NNQTLGQNAFTEWLDIMIASRDDGFLDTNDLFKTALHSYQERIRGRPQFVADIKRIEMILKTLES
ncbi:glycosyltransferase family 2 protein, partial [Paenibacillus sp. 28ISP30-2]|nr:glycosyltransferase family 2 protein [Paenibacillus sp. 28ISP30-2]